MQEFNFNEEKMRAIAIQEIDRAFKQAVFIKHEEIEDVVTTTVKKTLQGLGLDIEKPTEVQENFLNLREWSKMKRNIAQAVVALISRTILMGIIAIIIIGFHAWLSGNKPLL